MENSIAAWFLPRFVEPFCQQNNTTADALERISEGFAAAAPIHSGTRIVATGKPLVIPGLSDRGWYNASEVPQTATLEAAYPDILEELNSIREVEPTLQDYPMPGIEVDGSWRHFPLGRNGQAIQANCKLCPKTLKAVLAIGSFYVPGRSYFSALAPGSHIAAHRGPHNYRLRLHLGLDVPDDCAIRVGEETRVWEPGRCLVFNDYCEHEVWNRGNRARIVFITDLWHPELSELEIDFLCYLFKDTTPDLLRGRRSAR